MSASSVHVLFIFTAVTNWNETTIVLGYFDVSNGRLAYIGLCEPSLFCKKPFVRVGGEKREGLEEPENGNCA